MNGVVLLVGGLLLVAVIKLIIDRNWIGLLPVSYTHLGAGVPGDEKGASQHRSGYGISAPMPGAGKDNLMEEKYHER